MKIFKTHVVAFMLFSLIGTPIHAAKYDKKKPSDLYNKALEHLDKNQYGKAQKVLRIYTRKKRMMLMVGLFSLFRLESWVAMQMLKSTMKKP